MASNEDTNEGIGQDQKRIKLDNGNDEQSQTTASDPTSSSGSSACKEDEQTNATAACGDGNQSHDGEEFKFSQELSLEKIRQLQDEFCKERNWGQYHTPRNILLALVGEVGEAAELFQWKEDVKVGLPGWSETEKGNVGDELSDILIYLVRLAHRCHVDLPVAVLRKLEKNALKYPVDKAYGLSKKYTEYEKNST